MSEADFNTLLKPDVYQVFLFTCPPSLPLSFAAHPWFIVNKKGAVSRWEVIASPEMYDIKVRWGHVCKDVLPPWRGLRIMRSLRNRGYIWPSVLRGAVEGDEHSLAYKITECIESTPQTYPYKDEYAYTGPNSNTYVQWILNKFPACGLTLPWNSFGKKFK